MAYDSSKLGNTGQAIAGRSIFIYDGDDAVETVTGAGYISDATSRGMRVRDYVFIRGADAGVAAMTFVSAISSGAATLAPVAIGSVTSSAAEIDATTTDSLLGATTVAADVLAIPVTHAFVAKTTGADAEALTLANGTVGQMLTIYHVVDGGGDGTLTPATAAGWVSAVFDDAGDNLTLQYTNAGWVIRSNSGCVINFS